ncbi:Xaa-Pro dipeptidase [Clostridia bacterium]|nr:Xaa-Pro dipeptidase [Clostridia bacterium]
MIVKADTILTGDGKTVLRGSGVLIDESGHIVKIAPTETLKAGRPEEKLLDYGDATILPGLTDMHVHLGHSETQPDAGVYDEYLKGYLAVSRAKEALSLGITTLRDVSGPNHLCGQLRLAAEKGYIGDIPHIIHTNRGITATGGHGYPGDCLQVDGPDNLRQAVREEMREGADWIKIMTSHRGDVSEYTQAELDAAVDEAHRNHVKICVHAGTQPSIGMCIKAGFDTIEHGTFLTAEQAGEMAAKGIYWVPTIIAYTYAHEYLAARRNDTPANSTDRTSQKFLDWFEAARDAYRDNFKANFGTGVTVLCGTDMVLLGAPTVPVNRELQYMVEYGITPVQAVAAATGNCAKALGTAGIRGELLPGAEADILVVSGDVSRDITALNNVVEVFLQGKSVHRA